MRISTSCSHLQLAANEDPWNDQVRAGFAPDAQPCWCPAPPGRDRCSLRQGGVMLLTKPVAPAKLGALLSTAAPGTGLLLDGPAEVRRRSGWRQKAVPSGETPRRFDRHRKPDAASDCASIDSQRAGRDAHRPRDRLAWVRRAGPRSAMHPRLLRRGGLKRCRANSPAHREHVAQRRTSQAPFAFHRRKPLADMVHEDAAARRRRA